MNINLITSCMLFSFVATALFSSCKEDREDLVQVDKVNVTYTEGNEDFPNPERGFYRYSETSSSNYSVLDAATLRSYRTLQDIPSATYKVYSIQYAGLQILYP